MGLNSKNHDENYDGEIMMEIEKLDGGKRGK